MLHNGIAAWLMVVHNESASAPEKMKCIDYILHYIGWPRLGMAVCKTVWQHYKSLTTIDNLYLQ